MQRKKGIRLKKRRVLFLTVVLFLIAFLLATLRIVGLLNSLQSEEAVSEALMEARDMKTVNFLLTGVDSRGEGRLFLDQLLLVSYHPSQGKALILSIPGETQVFIKDYGVEKVENVYVLDSSSRRKPLLIETVSDLLNVPVHYFIELDYRGLPQAVDSINGVPVDVKESLIYDHRVVFPQGEYLVEEEEAYRYFTFFLEDEDNLNHLERQRLFMASLVQKVMNKNIVTGLPGAISKLSSLVTTNMSWREILSYYELFQEISYDAEVTTEVIPGREEVVEGVTYWIIDGEETRLLLNEFAAGETASPGITLEILNGKGEGGIANRLSRVLKGLGYEVVRVANADHFNYTTTRVISRAEELEDAARALADLIPGSEWEQDILEEYPVQITVILGHNFDEKELTERLR